MSFASQTMRVIDYAIARWKGETVGQAVGEQTASLNAANPKPFAELQENEYEYNPDAEFDELAKPVRNPMIAFHEALMADDPSKLSEDNPFKGLKLRVAEAWVFEGVCRHGGKLARDRKALEAIGIRWPAPYLVRHVESNSDYIEALTRSKKTWERDMPAKRKRLESARDQKLAFVKKLTEAKLLREDSVDCFALDTWGGPYDPNQFSEFAPLMAGPFNKQLYLTDYLRMHSLAFEAWNHNPLAKRIVELFAQYTFGRRFKVRIKDSAKEKAWEDFNNKHKIRENVSRYWIREFCIYGELMVNKEIWQLMDPSTVWDIVTDPDNINDVYYYYQSYPTAYQMFTGYRVAGEPGAEKQPGSEYIIRQIPAYKIIHLRGNCVSNEKRGRSLLFPILGWLKRIKDLYNAIVVRQWLMSCFIWDDTVKGSAADIAAHSAKYASMPKVGSTFVHNESVERQPMPAIDSAGGRGNASGIGEEIIAFIATAVGIPKEFLNVIASGGGSRAQALTSAEPFTKAIEDIQSTFEALLIEVCKEAFTQANLEYVEGDVEFIFPSVTKDTTTETIKNIATGESMGYVSKQTAAEMFAGEMNITNYDFEEEQGRINDEAQTGLNKMGTTPMPPGGRFGGNANPDNGSGSTVDSPSSNQDEEESPIHGNGKVSLSRSLKSL